MDYKKYFNRLVEKSATMDDQYQVTHYGNNHYVDLLSHKGVKFTYVISSKRSRAYGHELEGLIVEAYIDKEGYVDSYFNQLKMHKEEIENELQLDNIVWQSREQTLKQSAARIFAYKAVNLEDESKWDEYIEWQVNTMVKFLEVFPKYIDKFINDEVIERSNFMKVKFNDKVYKKNNRSGTALKDLCFDIFKQYLDRKPGLGYEEVKNVFNQLHCWKKDVVLSKNDWEQKTEDRKERYFKPISYNGMELYFTTQWGNNDGDCDNINKVITFAKNEGYDIEILDSQINDEVEDVKMQKNTVKNIILYGVPGVGKTHNTSKLIKLIENENSEKEIFEAIKRNELNSGTDMSGLRDRVSFVTFHQSFGYEDFIEGFRPNEEGQIELIDGIFKQLADKARKNLEDSQKESDEISQAMKFQQVLQSFIDEVETSIEDNDIYPLTENVYIFEVEDDAFRYKGDNWTIHSSGIRMRFDILEKLYIAGVHSRKDVKNIEGIGGLVRQHATYFWKLLEKIYAYEKNQNIQVTEVRKIERKNYYLIIDEINRGNISKIFGELITLIEEDKRDTLEVTLPYSKEKFSVPSNLFIIGTMNSTDKSIALIDVALRRRFTFLKMEPNDQLIEDAKTQKLFNDLNTALKDKLGEDHQIGHSYFMNIQSKDDLDFVLEYKIKPLLEEYFYGDNDGLEEVLKICEFGENG